MPLHAIRCTQRLLLLARDVSCCNAPRITQMWAAPGDVSLIVEILEYVPDHTTVLAAVLLL